MTLSDFKRFSPPELLRNIKMAYFCGNFGDPAVVPDMQDILDWCWQVNPDLELKLFSNCSVRSVNWWRDLGELTSDRNFSLIAAIDGASQETNRRYRVRTDFDRIMANTAAFIGAGGNAEWRMLVFRHNEHEVENAKHMAAERGFSLFRAYPSNRFGSAKAFEYTHKDEAFTLEPPTAKIPPKSSNTHSLVGQKPPDTEVIIECEALRTSSAFVDFLGYLTPCCHIGRRLYMRDQGAFDGADDWMSDLFDTFDPKLLHVDTAGFDAADAANDAFFVQLKEKWKTLQPRVCRNVCGKRRIASDPAEK